MKKLITIFFSLFLLAGCFNQPPSLEDRIRPSEDQMNKNEYIGTIEPLELDIYQQGTHQVVTDSGFKYLIQSSNINLNRYLGKKVKVSGSIVPGIGDGKDVLNVKMIELEDGDLTDEQNVYESTRFGFRFSYPSLWDLVESGDGLQLRLNRDWVDIQVFSTNMQLNAFVFEREEGTGTAITVGNERAIRYTEGDTIKVYLSNPSKQKIYLITFNPDAQEDDEGNVEQEKDHFYSLLESFELLRFVSREGDLCGGEEKITCPEDYRCELKGPDVNAEGICVPLDEEATDETCPYISTPANCDRYEVSEYTASGCPIRYTCLDSETEQPGQKDFDQQALIRTIEKYQDKLLRHPGAEIVRYELSKDERLIAVVYNSDDSLYKILFAFTPSANEFNFSEKAYFESEGGAFVLISGQDLQEGLPKEVISLKQDDIAIVSDDMRLYENPHKHFSVVYPKDWYYRSFGPADKVDWVVGFSDKALDSIDDSIVKLMLNLENPVFPSSFYSAEKVIDDSVFIVVGPSEFKEVVDQIKDSIEMG